MIRAALVLVTVLATPLQAEIPVREITTPGGITAWLVQSPDIPVIALEIRFRGGATVDLPGKEGAVNLMSGLLEEGAGDLDARGFAEAREGLAASLRFGASLESVSVSARFLSETRAEVTALLKSALNEPRFDPEALDRVRGQVLASIRSEARDPGAIAGRTFAELAFPDHPYARPTNGTEASVMSLTVDDMREARIRALARDRVHVAAAGDISAEDLAALLDDLLGDLPATGPALPAPVVPALTGQTKVVPFPGPQSVVLFGHKGLRPGDPDFFAAFVANERLGGGRFDARLMTEVREKRGLTYGIGSGMAIYDQSELIQGQMQTANATAAQAIEVVRAEWERIAREGISAEELDSTKRFLTGSYPLRFDSNAAIARILVGLQMQGYDVDYPTRRNGYIEAVTLEDVQRAAARMFDPSALSFVVVGTPDGLENQ